MSSSVSVITGLKWATFDQPRADQVTGRLNGEPQAIMHAFTPLKNNARGYAYLSASLQKVEEFEKIALDERGRGAVSGGYVTAMTITSAGRLARGTTVNEQEWGTVNTSGGTCVGGFYEAEDARYIRVMVCFDRTNVAPVSGFWSNDKVLIGPDIKCDKTDWGVNLKNVLEPTTFSLVPEKGKLCFHVDDCRLFVLRVKLAKVRGVGNSLFIILSVYSSVTRGALRLTYNDLK